MTFVSRTRRGRGSRALVVLLTAVLGLTACSSGPHAPSTRTDERLPDRAEPTPTIRNELPGERQVGVVLLVLLGIAAAGGIAYLNYELFAD